MANKLLVNLVFKEKALEAMNSLCKDLQLPPEAICYLALSKLYQSCEVVKKNIFFENAVPPTEVKQ